MAHGIPTKIPLSQGVRYGLGVVRRQAKAAGVVADTRPWKDAYRAVYAHFGPNEADRFATGFKMENVHRDTLLQDMKYGFDEVDYPLGAPPLPRGALNDDARRAAKAAAIIARRRAAKYGPRG